LSKRFAEPEQVHPADDFEPQHRVGHELRLEVQVRRRAGAAGAASVEPDVLLPAPDDQAVVVGERLHGGVGDRGSRPEHEHGERRDGDRRESFSFGVLKGDGFVVPVDAAVFDVEMRHRVADFRKGM
jgi:hypothetical protein